MHPDLFISIAKEVTMAHIASLLVLCAVAAAVLCQEPQAGPNTAQDGIAQSGANWTTCDMTTTPYLSCQDCKTRLICKPVGGLLITCNSPLKPYCNAGICSPIPSAECA